MMESYLHIVLLFVYSPYGNAISISIDYNNKTNLNPGESFYFKCHGNPINHDRVIQIFKSNFIAIPEYILSLKKTIVKSSDLVISNRNLLTPAVVQHAGDRYTLSQPSPDDVYIRISQLKPEDSGMWGCRIMNLDLDKMLIEGPKVNVTIYGPLFDVYLTDGRSNPPISLALDKPFTVVEGKKLDFGCSINASNVYPNYSIILHRQDGSQSILTWQFRSWIHPAVSSSIGYQKMFVHLAPDPKMRKIDWTADHGTVSCSAWIRDGPRISSSVTLDVHFSPRLAECSPWDVEGKVGSTNVSITCKFRANPQPEVAWTGPSRFEVKGVGKFDEGFVTLQKLRSNEYLTALTISRVTPSRQGKYFLHIKNEHGRDKAQGQISEVVVASGVTCCRLTCWDSLLFAIAGIFSCRALWLR